MNIILADDKTMTVNGNTININANDLTIYGQSGQSGSLKVLNPPSNASGAIYGNQGSFIINGGTVNATGNSTSGIGIYAKYVTINGGNVTARATA